jgi:hypothetical protein
LEDRNAYVLGAPSSFFDIPQITLPENQHQRRFL